MLKFMYSILLFQLMLQIIICTVMMVGKPYQATKALKNLNIFYLIHWKKYNQDSDLYLFWRSQEKGQLGVCAKWHSVCNFEMNMKRNHDHIFNIIFYYFSYKLCMFNILWLKPIVLVLCRHSNFNDGQSYQNYCPLNLPISHSHPTGLFTKQSRSGYWINPWILNQWTNQLQCILFSIIAVPKFMPFYSTGCTPTSNPSVQIPLLRDSMSW